MILPLVDFHCHLDLYTDYKQLIRDTEQAGVYTLAVTTTPRAWTHNKALMNDLVFVKPALGLHPQLVGKDTKRELILWKKYLHEADYVGEVGLDASPNFIHTLEEQKMVFEQILQACNEYRGKVLSVHAVRSQDILLDMISSLLPMERGRVVLHWFSGSKSQLKRAIELGCYLSVNTSMLNSSRGRSLVDYIPLERLLTETDGPFILQGGLPAKPSDVLQAVTLLANLKGMSVNNVKTAITSNLKDLLNTKLEQGAVSEHR